MASAESSEVGEPSHEGTCAGLNVVVLQPLLLARVVAFVGTRETSKLFSLNRRWAREIIKPAVWEILAGMPHQPLLVNCFRRAASYCYREVDVPSPNVNRRGSPPVIRACLLSDRASMREYAHDLREMTNETKWLESKPTVFSTNEVGAKSKELLDDFDRAKAGVFDNVQILTSDRFGASQDPTIFSGSLQDGRAAFYLWSLSNRSLRSSMTQNSASCYHACNDALAVGCMDGTVKIWDFNQTERLNASGRMRENVPATASISHRSSLGLVPFLRTRTKDKVMNVYLDHNDGSLLHMATSTEKGEVNVWDVLKGEILLTIDAAKIHRSALPRSTRETNPQITSLMLFRNTLVCGTSSGFIRVFDVRSGRLTHRLAGHPDAVVKTDTKGRVLWSAGKEGSVRWWGGKTAKVLTKSALCEGEISALEMDESVVVAGYGKQGMEAWDVRTQQALCTFSSSAHGGIKSVQFDSRKLVTVSRTGKAALWRWYSSTPVKWFNPPATSSGFVSVQFNNKDLLLGTDCGELVDFNRFSMS